MQKRCWPILGPQRRSRHNGLPHWTIRRAKKSPPVMASSQNACASNSHPKAGVSVSATSATRLTGASYVFRVQAGRRTRRSSIASASGPKRKWPKKVLAGAAVQMGPAIIVTAFAPRCRSPLKAARQLFSLSHDKGKTSGALAAINKSARTTDRLSSKVMPAG